MKGYIDDTSMMKALSGASKLVIAFPTIFADLDELIVKLSLSKTEASYDFISTYPTVAKANFLF
jgi:hypothetical protein